MSNGPYVGIEALANYFGVSTSTIRQWLRADKIPDSTYLRVGLTYRFHLRAIEDALLNYKSREGMTSEERAKFADAIIQSLDSSVDETQAGISERRLREANAELDAKSRGVPYLKEDQSLDEELSSILEDDELKDI